ncbi:MAG TPA: prepilin-type N-terminal cleavage/methylation domain-containing protein [Smithellaceae bacterium]|nr:prepilin-type N-terminal cleavage/methylation domain-containing protein [Smithellaceae bacterium]HRS89203.1 prepilin-type N-terminal cleavage/methylation domain-containing protein [Smithellaceae bacterium]HRV26127.1 prepilin-type N-terminal cleavage/methylation domain-containing protein [Smithellaceae bacterium]
MKVNSNNKQSGFTLVEVIVVLVLLGIVAAGLSGAIIYGAQHFIFAREANQLSQKAQLAMARMKRELVDVKSIATANANTIQYTLATGGEYAIQLSGAAINMQGINPVIAAQPLINGLAEANGGQTFLTYRKADNSAWTTADSINDLAQIQAVIVLAMPGQPNLTFQTTINPRRTAIPSVPRLN